MVNHYDEFKADLAEFRAMTEKFYKKEITVPEYKGFSGGFGSYAQRGAERSMLRLRLSGGEMNRQQIKFIADSIDKYDIEQFKRNIDKMELELIECIAENIVRLHQRMAFAVEGEIPVELTVVAVLL